MNILFCSVGRRGELIKNFKQSMGKNIKVVATDNSKFAPALYLADKHYLVPLIFDSNYINCILNICINEKIQAITTFIDPEIEILAKNRNKFEAIGVTVLAPFEETAHYCFDKFEMFKYLSKHNIATVPTYDSLEQFTIDLNLNKISFPVFVKPRNGSGSVGAKKVDNYTELSFLVNENPNLIIQKLMIGLDIDADVYIDTISNKAVSAFTKRKIQTTIGGANKTISFKDEILFEFIKKIVSIFEFCGPIDIDFFKVDNVYYLSEINPRFGGAYLHAFGAGVDFIKLINNNVLGKTNPPEFGNYDENVVMMMYDSVVICTDKEMIDDWVKMWFFQRKYQNFLFIVDS